MNKFSLTRRQFLGTGAAGFATVTIVPRAAVAASGQTPPNEKLNIAGIGVGGRGASDMGEFGGENIVALCDVDTKRSGATLQKFSKAKTFRDFRKMFDAMEKQVDAVLVATPDHTHAVAAMAAIRRGKHVYCEKPLAHSVYEVRQLMKAAVEHKVVTQLGNQGHSSDSIRMFCEWIWDGAIGNVHTIHAGCASHNSGLRNLVQLGDKEDVAANLDWDLWLGPTQFRPYHSFFLPGAWRRWMPFGNGTVGDWTCHVVDPVFWALDLGAPRTIQAEVKDYDFKTQGASFPEGEIITYEFPAKGKRGPVTMHWYSGAQKIPRPKELAPDRKSVETGAVAFGDKGTIMYGSHGAGGVRIIPEAKMRAYKLPGKTIPRIARGSHHQDWLQAIRKGGKAGSDFSYGGPLTEIALLGVIAIKMSGKKLQWDATAMQFTNCPEANEFLTSPYRPAWVL